MSLISRVFEKLNLFFRMIFINKKYTLVAFVGLGISLSLISTSLIFLYSYQFNAFNKYVVDHPEEQITISPNNMLNSFGQEDTLIPDLNSLVDTSISDSGLQGRVSYRGWYNRRAVVLPYEDRTHYNTTELLPLSMVGVPVEFFDILQPYLIEGGRMPASSNEIIILLRSEYFSTTNISVGEQNIFVISNPINIWASVWDGVPNGGVRMNVTGIINVYDLQNSLNNTSDSTTKISNLFSVIDTDEMILTFHKNVMDFTSGLTGMPSLVAPNKQTYVGSILFNLNEVNAFRINDDISNLIAFSEQLRTSIETTSLTNDVHIDLDLVVILQGFASEFEVFKIFTLLFMVPIISMALSLTAYSTNLVKKRRKRQLALLGQRGVSQFEILFMLFSETLLFTVIAIVISFIIAYPYSFLILKSDAFLSFQGEIITPQLYIFIIEIIIAIGFGGSLLVNFSNIWNLSKISAEEAFSETKTKKPFWERFYIDIFFLIVGIVAWIITFYQLRNTAVSSAFARVLGTPAPILIIVGTVLFISRLYPLITTWLSKISWKYTKLEMISISLRSLSRRRSASMRSLVLIMLTFTMAIISIVIPDTYQNFDYENAAYDIGSDIVISGVSMNDPSFQANIEAIEGVEDTTYVALLTYNPISRGSIIYSYSIVGINTSEFANVAFFEDEYLDDDLEETLTILAQPPELGSSANVLIQEDQVKAFNLTEGKNFNITYLPSGSNVEYNYTVTTVGFYNYWPTLYKIAPEQGSTIFRLGMVTNLATIYALAMDSANVNVQLYVDVKDDYIVETVADDIRGKVFGRRIEDIDERVTISTGSLRAAVIYGSLNSNFIASIFILIFAMSLMMVIHSLERSNEVGILKAIGISPKQLFSFFFVESLTVIIVGAIVGTFLGMITSYMFMSIITINRFIPPWGMVFSPWKIIGTILVMLFASMLSSAIPGVLFSRRKEAQIMREL